MSRRKLRLVGLNDDATTIFDDLSALRGQQHKPLLHHRKRMTETFARIPHDRALTLYQNLGGPAWVILIELDWLIMRGRGRNPVKLTSRRLADIGIAKHTRQRALRQLEAAGIIAIENPGPGQSLLIRHLWFSVSPGEGPTVAKTTR